MVDDRISFQAELRFRDKLRKILQAHLRSVDIILILAVAEYLSLDHYCCEIDREHMIMIIKMQGNGRHIHTRALCGSGKNEILALF